MMQLVSRVQIVALFDCDRYALNNIFICNSVSSVNKIETDITEMFPGKGLFGNLTIGQSKLGNRTREEGVNFSRFCANVFYGRPLSNIFRHVLQSETFLKLLCTEKS